MNLTDQGQLPFSVRQTSRDVYRQIEEDQSLAVGQFRVYRILYKADHPLTGQEVNEILNRPNGHKRLSELRNLRVVKESEPRACTVTGKRATTWTTNGQLPDAAPRTKRIQKPGKVICDAAATALIRGDGYHRQGLAYDDVLAVAAWLRS